MIRLRHLHLLRPLAAALGCICMALPGCAQHAGPPLPQTAGSSLPPARTSAPLPQPALPPGQALQAPQPAPAVSQALPAPRPAPGTSQALPAPPPGAERDQPPPPAPPRPLAIDTPFDTRLANGLRLVVARRPGVQLVTAELLVLAGAETDPPGRAGTAQLTAGLLTKGSRHRSATDMANAAEALGGTLDSNAGWNQSSLGITVSAVALDAALGLIREAATEPTFAPAELDRLRSQAIDGMAVAYTQPGTLASLVAQRLRFGTGAYGHPASGTPTSLPRIERADVVALHASRWRPDNAVLVLAGDIDVATAQGLATRHFGAWRPSASASVSASGLTSASRLALARTTEPATTPETAASPSAREPAPAGGTAAATAGFESGLPLRTVVVDLPNSGQASVALFVPVPPRGVDRAAADVMNSVLGGGYSSRLNAEIRIKRGLSYGASSRLDARRDGGLLYASAQTRNDAAAEVALLLQAEFDRLMTEPVPVDELDARKATLIGEFGRGVETTSGLAGVVASLVVAGLPVDELGRRIGELSAVSAADVQRYAAAQLGAGARRLVVAGEAARFQSALQATAPGGAAAIVTVAAPALDLDAPAGLDGR